MPTPEARRWVFFDIGDTLINLKPEVYRRWAAEISSQNGRTIGSAELKRAIQEELEQPHRAGQHLHPPAGDGEIAFLEALYRDVLVRLGHADAAIPGAGERWDEVVAAMVREAMEPDSFDWRQGMQETVGKLRAEGVKMGIISNAFASVHGLLDHFRMCEVSTGAHSLTRVSPVLLPEPCLPVSRHTALPRLSQLAQLSFPP